MPRVDNPARVMPFVGSNPTLSAQASINKSQGLIDGGLSDYGGSESANKI